MIQMLKMLERFPMGDPSQGFGFAATRTLNVMIEAMRLAFADRAVWMGDEDFVDVPKEGLIDDNYVAMRSAPIDPNSRMPEAFPDDPRPFDSALSLPRSSWPHCRLNQKGVTQRTSRWWTSGGMWCRTPLPSRLVGVPALWFLAADSC